MPFMPLSSKTCAHLEIFSRLGRPSSEIFFSRLGIPSFEMYIFCNTMSPSLDNDCAIQDLAFQVLKLFGAKNFNIRPLPRIMSFMTWSSKTWTQVNMIVKTWQPQQFWNLTFFFQDLAISHVLNCYFFATPCPQDLTMIALFKTWLSKSWNFRVKTFNIRPLPRIMSFMTWSSKTWTHLEIFFKTWQPQFWNLTFFQDFEPKFWNVTFFCNPMSPSLDNDCTIQDLAFQVLKLFGVKNFNIRPLPWIMSFMTWSSKTWTHLEIFLKTWQPQFWNLACFQDLESQVLKCFFWQFHVPKSWQWLHYSRLGFPTLETFWAK